MTPTPNTQPGRPVTVIQHSAESRHTHASEAPALGCPVSIHQIRAALPSVCAEIVNESKAAPAKRGGRIQ